MTENQYNRYIKYRKLVPWDDVPVPGIGIADLDKESFDVFRKGALRKGRMTREELEVPKEELLEKLGLIKDGMLTRAAVMCFYREPGKIIDGCYARVGMLDGWRVVYQHEFCGSLMLIADRLIDFMYLYFMKARISYYRWVREETYPYARDAVSEAVYN